MAKRIVDETELTLEDKKIIKALADGKSLISMPNDKDMKISLNERQIYYRVNYLKILYQCKNLTHLIATFLRKKIIK